MVSRGECRTRSFLSLSKQFPAPPANPGFFFLPCIPVEEVAPRCESDHHSSASPSVSPTERRALECPPSPFNGQRQSFREEGKSRTPFLSLFSRFFFPSRAILDSVFPFFAAPHLSPPLFPSEICLPSSKLRDFLFIGPDRVTWPRFRRFPPYTARSLRWPQVGFFLPFSSFPSPPGGLLAFLSLSAQSPSSSALRKGSAPLFEWRAVFFPFDVIPLRASCYHLVFPHCRPVFFMPLLFASRSYQIGVQTGRARLPFWFSVIVFCDIVVLSSFSSPFLA